MTQSNWIEQLQEIFREVFQDPDLVLARHTSPSDLLDWDSLGNIRLLMTIEKRFGLTFQSKEAAKFACFGDILDAVIQKKGA